MGVPYPYRRTVRQLQDGSYSNSGNSGYIKDSDYAQSPEKYIRSFLLIQNDLQKLFEYLEPADHNKRANSHRIHELFIRVCIEVEANFKAILRENGYSRKKERNWNIKDYYLVERSHKLSDYEVLLPRWDGKYGRFKPFINWSGEGYRKLNWYGYYNAIKHDIHSNFKHANIKNLVEATCGLVALLSAQFLSEDFSSGNELLWVGGPSDGMESAIGEYFKVKYPTWPEEERYDFQWEKIKNEPDRIKLLDYNSL